MRAARDSGLAPTAEQQAAYEARERAAITARDGVPRNLSIAGNVAEIRVEGVLTEKLDFFAFLFGGGNTTYRSIRDAVAAAESDPNVRQIIYTISSPGGDAAGLFETLAAIDAAQKPATVLASQATSAAYAIAAVAGKIKASTPASMFGSIGVAASFLNLEEVVDITNTESPDKRPDINSEEGKNVVRKQLDGIFDVFVDAIAQGRNVDTKQVVENYGRGAVVVAKEAKRLGMIDSVPSRGVSGARAENDAAPVAQGDGAPEASNGSGPVADDRAGADQVTQPAPQRGNQPSASATQGGAANERRKLMTKEELRAQHPELYTAVLMEGEKAGTEKGYAAGVAEGKEEGRKLGLEEGAKEERERVEAHLEMGKSCGAMDMALEHISSGVSLMNQKVYAGYTAAAVNKRDSDLRQADSDKAGEAVNGAKTTSEPAQKSAIDQALDLREAHVADVVEASK